MTVAWNNIRWGKIPSKIHQLLPVYRLPKVTLINPFLFCLFDHPHKILERISPATFNPPRHSRPMVDGVLIFIDYVMFYER